MTWSFLPSFVGRAARAVAPAVTLGVVLLSSLPAWAGEPVIKLLSAGEGAKNELRIHPKVGGAESFEMVMKMKMTMDMGGMGQMPQELPPIVMRMDAKVTAVAPNGDVSYDFTLADVSLREGADPAMAEALKSAMGPMVGTKGTVTVTNRGLTRSSKLTPPPGVPAEQFAQMQKGMQHASAPFPVEPVGVGAKWEVSQLVEDNGLKLNQVTTYTLKSWSGDVVVVDAALVQNADAQAVITPDLPPGSSATLESLTSSGTGSTTFSLAHVFPTSAKLDHKMNTRMKISAEGQEMSMGMGMDLGLEMSRK